MTRIVIATEHYPPTSLAGVAQTMSSLARRFAASGNDVSVIVVDGGAGSTVTAGLEGHRITRVHNDEALLVHLAGRPPEALLATGHRMPSVVRRLGRGPFRTCHYFQDSHSGTAVNDTDPADTVVFTSEYLRRSFARGKDATDLVIPPLVERDRYTGVAGARTHVTAFGLARLKRPDIVNLIARRLPGIRFEVFNSWSGPRRLRHLPLYLRRNICIREPERAAADIYRNTRIILVASDSEGWCRVVTEGQFAGIPSIGRELAALPESFADGGVLLPADALIDDWVERVERAFVDGDYYEQLVEAARFAGERSLVDPERIVADWQRALTGNICAESG